MTPYKIARRTTALQTCMVHGLICVVMCLPSLSHRRYCPSVITTNENDLYTKPKTQLTLLLKPKRPRHNKKSQDRKRSQEQSDPSWLYPILLPSIFPTLFSLYKAQNSEQDLQLRTTIIDLQSRTDKDLCEILDIKRYLSPLHICIFSSSSHEALQYLKYQKMRL